MMQVEHIMALHVYNAPAVPKLKHRFSIPGSLCALLAAYNWMVYICTSPLPAHRWMACLYYPPVHRFNLQTINWASGSKNKGKMFNPRIILIPERCAMFMWSNCDPSLKGFKQTEVAPDGYLFVFLFRQTEVALDGYLFVFLFRQTEVAYDGYLFVFLLKSQSQHVCLLLYFG